MKLKRLHVRISEEQERILESKAKTAGFSKTADYVRFVLFKPQNIEEMIKQIHAKVVKNDKIRRE